jgi:hypothetical protein
VAAVAAERKIILNEKHLALFKEKPGLERSTIGHEAGHWDVDIDRVRLLHPTFPGFEVQPQVVKRHARKAEKLIEVSAVAKAITGLPLQRASQARAG